MGWTPWMLLKSLWHWAKGPAARDLQGFCFEKRFPGQASSYRFRPPALPIIPLPSTVIPRKVSK
jgi:hypothetical protein